MTTEGIKRKLTTILAADVVGYSGMMAADEEATLRTLRAYCAVIDELTARHDGRLFNTAGSAARSRRCAAPSPSRKTSRSATPSCPTTTRCGSAWASTSAM